jgi:hypothetical protein
MPLAPVGTISPGFPDFGGAALLFRDTSDEWPVGESY